MARRMLLASAALTTLHAFSACKEKEQLPGNPKGSFYDPALADAGGNAVTAPKDAAAANDAKGDRGSETDAGGREAGVKPVTLPTTTPVTRHLPANPKGSHYDRGLTKPTPGGR